jgi:hypothetical protein
MNSDVSLIEDNDGNTLRTCPQPKPAWQMAGSNLIHYRTLLNLEAFNCDITVI